MKGISKKIVAAMLTAVIVGGVATTVVWRATSSHAETQVRLVTMRSGQDATVEEFATLATALSRASSQSGFLVHPLQLPDGYAVTEVDVSPPPVSPSLPARVTLKAATGDRGFQLMEASAPFQFLGQGAESLVASLGTGAQVYRVPGDLSIDYTLLTPTRGYVLTVGRPAPISDAEAIKILSTLPLD